MTVKAENHLVNFLANLHRPNPIKNTCVGGRQNTTMLQIIKTVPSIVHKG